MRPGRLLKRFPYLQPATHDAIRRVLAALDLSLAKARVVERLHDRHDLGQPLRVGAHRLLLDLPPAGLSAKAKMLLSAHGDHRHLGVLQQRLVGLALLRLGQWPPRAAEHDVRVVAHPLGLVLAGDLLQLDRALD
jgi:hypothetical protein